MTAAGAALELTADVENPECSVHEALRLRCSLRNEDGTSVELPGPYDRSGAFQVRLRDETFAVLRQMDRRTRQAMLNDGRIDTSLSLARLDGHKNWDWKVDLASFHFPQVPGDFFLDTELSYPAAKVNLNSGLRRVSVAADPLVELTQVRDNPVIERTTLLLEAETAGGRGFFLRQHNPDRPLGAWYSRRILEDENPETVVLARSAFFQTSSLAPAFRHWVLWLKDATLFAQAFDDGVPAAATLRSARLPESRFLTRFAFWTVDNLLYAILRTAAGLLECYRVEERRLSKVFEYQAPAGLAEEAVIGADEERLHLAVPWRGILYETLNWKGKRLERIHAHRTRLRCHSLEYDGAGHRFNALFGERAGSGMLQMVTVNPLQDRVSAYTVERLPLREQWREVSFDQDRRGRFHYLVSTEKDRLYYFSEERGPVLVAEGEYRYFPIVAAPLKVYFGLYRRDYGFRLVQFQRRRQGKKISGLEAHPKIVI